jgi:hypothetical protein
MINGDNIKVGMRVRRNTRTWVDAERLGINEGMTGITLENPTGIGVRVLFENGVDTYCWGDDLDPAD